MATATQTQFRRGTGAQNDGVTLAASEAVIDTTNHRWRIHDAIRAGGYPVPNFSDIQKQAFTAPTVGGTGNAITLTNAVPCLAYASPLRQVFVATSANTTGVTVNVDGLGVKNIYKIKNGVLTALESGDLISGGLYEITYDGTQFQIKALDESRGTTAGLTLLALVTGGGAAYSFTSLIDSAYKNYVFVLENVQVPGGSTFYIRCRRSGVGSFDAGATDYSYALNEAELYFPSSTPGARNTPRAGRDTGIVMSLGQTGTSFGFSGVVTGHGLAQSALSHFNYDLSYLDTEGGFGFLAGSNLKGMGALNSPTALDGVQFIPSSGSFSSGSIYMYGMKSSL